MQTPTKKIALGSNSIAEKVKIIQELQVDISQILSTGKEDPDSLSIISHDIVTSEASIQGIDTLKELGTKMEGETLEMVLQELSKNELTLRRVKKALIDYQNLSEGIKLETESINLLEALKWASRKSSFESRTTFEVDPEIHIDFCQGAIFGVFSNLITNAKNAIEKQREHIDNNKQTDKLTITHKIIGEYQTITFHNYGTISDKITTQNIFEKGVTDGGTGIGLRSVARRVKSLGGTITYTGSPKEGTTFTVSLPIKQ